MEKITRRQFLYCSAAFLSSTLPAQAYFTAQKNLQSGAADIRGKVFKGDAPDTLWKWSHEGHLYKKLSNSKVVCGICPNRCVLAEGDRSVCRSKVNMDGKLYSLTYGNPCAVNVDPIEKKPLFHFKPKSKAFSIICVQSSAVTPQRETSSSTITTLFVFLTDSITVSISSGSRVRKSTTSTLIPFVSR